MSINYILQLEVANSLLEDKLEKVTKEFFEFRKKLYGADTNTCNLEIREGVEFEYSQLGVICN